MFEAKVSEIYEFNGLSAVKFTTKFTKLTMVSLEIPRGISLESAVKIGFKSSEVIIATQKLQNCSLSNEIPCVIQEAKFGEILTSVKLKTSSDEIFESIITTNSAKRLNLKSNLSVFAYIKATSLFIDEIL